MRPLNMKQDLGSTGIAVTFNNGAGTVTGYIKDQIGTNKFIVTDGTTEVVARLAPTTDIASDLASNPTYCTVTVAPPDGATEYVMRIWSERVRTTDGNTYKWSLNTSENGSAVVTSFS